MTWKTPVRGVASLLLISLLPAVSLANGEEGKDLDPSESKLDDLESQIKELREQQAQGRAETDQSFDEFDEMIAGITKNLSMEKGGNRKFLLSGYASGGFENAEGEDSSFSGQFVPIFLWELGDNLFFEGEVEFELEGTETAVELEYAQLSYVLSDSVILGFGRFLNPANPFADRLHPSWINKLPDSPLALGPMRIMPFTQTGIQVHGGVPVGSQKINYSVYVSNGTSQEEDAGNFGTLADENVSDSNNSKAVGGRLGYFPLPELEIGYSIELAQVTPSGSESADADAKIQSVDLNYVTSAANGTLDVRGQWVFSDVDTVIFDPTGADFGPATISNNRRDGGYAQCAYRPSESNSEILSQLEGVVRYDMVDLPTGAPEGTDQSRWTVGVNFWAAASSVFKLAYRIDDTSAPGMDSNAVLFQWAVGL